MEISNVPIVSMALDLIVPYVNIDQPWKKTAIERVDGGFLF